MDDVRTLLHRAVDAALEGDLQALLMAQMLLGHLRGRQQAATLLAGTPGTADSVDAGT
jgi:hypothetical protein